MTLFMDVPRRQCKQLTKALQNWKIFLKALSETITEIID